MKIVPNVKGFRIYYPEIYEKYLKVSEILRKTAKKFGYRTIETPALEFAEILTKKGGLSPDQTKEIFIFEDYGGRKVGLRFDLTTPIARILAEDFEYLKKKPIRFDYFTRLWRYEEPQKGRYREFYQYGVELIGYESEVLSCAEIFNLMAMQLKDLGLDSEKYKILVSDRNILNRLLESNIEAIREIDKKGKVPDEEIIEKCVNLGCCQKTVEEILSSGYYKISEIDKMPLLNNEEKEKFKKIFELVNEDLRGYFLFDISIARGFDYYTGIIFEIFKFENDKKTGKALGGGGEYRSLISLFGGPEVNAIGYAFGVDRILEEINIEIEKTPKIHVITTKEHIKQANQIAQKLRENNISTTFILNEYDSFKKLLNKELKFADRNDIDYVLIVDDKINQGKVLIKDLNKREQKEVSLDNLISMLRF